MTSPATFEMRVRVGNWGSVYELPPHRSVTLTLAPDDDPTAVVVLDPAPSWATPPVLTADLVDEVVVDANGRVLLDTTRPGRPVAEAADAAGGPWQIRVSGPRGWLQLYSDGPAPDRAVLEALRARVTAVTPAG